MHVQEPGVDPKRAGNGHSESHLPEFQTARLGIWLFIGSLGAMFTALGTVWLYRLHDRLNYYFEAPKSLWLSTALLLASSVTMALAVRAVRKGDSQSLRKFLTATLSLGMGFLISQLFAWEQLWQAGLFAQSNPFSGLFYVMTALHALHLIGGLIWLFYVRRAAAVFTAKKHLAVDLCSVYWHFMDIVWLAFFAVVMFL